MVKNQNFPPDKLERISILNGLHFDTVATLLEWGVLSDKKLRTKFAKIEYDERVKQIVVIGHDDYGKKTYESVMMDVAFKYKVSEHTLNRMIYPR